jgi:hypothetical protein
MILKLTRYYEGDAVYINGLHITRFYGESSTGGTQVDMIDHGHYQLVKETPEEIMKLFDGTF